ncbi:MAG: diacylglycerol/lipid kinase family protein [Phycisphaeraceae bacterium]
MPEASDRQSVLVVGNPFSVGGARAGLVDRLIGALRGAGLETRIAWNLDERRSLLAAPDLGSWCRCVISVGGDGTIADVVNDLTQGGEPARVALAMLPTGNENLFAREMGFARGRPERLASALAAGRTRLVDAGRTDGRLFTLMVSAGFDAEVVRRVDLWRKQGRGVRRVGRLSYLRPILHALARYDYPELTLEADGQVVRGSHVMVFNIGRYGGGLGVCRHARCDDERLDWLVFQRPGLAALLRYGLGVALARHLGRGDVLAGQAGRVRIGSGGEEPVPVQIDGDPAGWTPQEVDVWPGALRVVDVRGLEAGG